MGLFNGILIRNGVSLIGAKLVLIADDVFQHVRIRIQIILCTTWFDFSYGFLRFFEDLLTSWMMCYMEENHPPEKSPIG